MSQKKKKISAGSDVTLNDYANAKKPCKKFPKYENKEELSWDSIDVDELDLSAEIGEDGTKTFTIKTIKKKPNKINDVPLNERPGLTYPEIIWHLISLYIKPEDIATFACINKSTYTITKKANFWQNIYKKYCKYSKNLPPKLRIEHGYSLYGLKQRVVRALFHTYQVFSDRIHKQDEFECKPHTLIKQKCVNIWYTKSTTCWLFFFKFKQSINYDLSNLNLIQMLSNIDANHEDSSQVLQITCQQFFEIPPLMGMTLCSVGVFLAQGFRHHRVNLGFTSSSHNINRATIAENIIVLDYVTNITLYDWWHPRFPYTERHLRSSYLDDEEIKPVLEKDFLSLVL